jgi:small subunit ribosomal protein S18
MAENNVREPKAGREFGGSPMRPRRSKRKTCAFCAAKTEQIDFLDASGLTKYTSERGKIFPRRMTGTCAKHQRELTTAIKRARQLALLPYDAG